MIEWMRVQLLFAGFKNRVQSLVLFSVMFHSTLFFILMFDLCFTLYAFVIMTHRCWKLGEQQRIMLVTFCTEFLVKMNSQVVEFLILVNHLTDIWSKTTKNSLVRLLFELFKIIVWTKHKQLKMKNLWWSCFYYFVTFHMPKQRCKVTK